MKLNKYIDHTNLKPNATKEDILKLCKEAKDYDFASVCINGGYIKLVANELKDTDVKVCSVVGFPLGAMTKETKVFETKNAIGNGAGEIDMVINISALKNKDFKYVEEEIREIVEVTKNKAIVKVIIETCLLTEEEKVKACELAVKSGAGFVKTSTGFSTGGATVEDIALMKKVVNGKAEIKASGGIRTREDAIKMIEVGATRIGASSGIQIVEG